MGAVILLMLTAVLALSISSLSIIAAVLVVILPYVEGASNYNLFNQAYDTLSDPINAPARNQFMFSTTAKFWRTT